MEFVCLRSKQEEWKKLSLKEITERINLHYKEDKKSLQWWSIQIARASMVQVMSSLWSLFLEFLASYSRCRVSNGVMPCVLGPTSFYLKFWVNILIKDDLQNVVVFLMIFIWVHHDIHLDSSCMNEHMNFWAHHMRFIWFPRQYPRVVAFPHTSESLSPIFAYGLVHER